MKSSYVSPNTLLNAGGALYAADTANRAGARDLSQPVYTPWRTTGYTPGDVPMVSPAEFLQALRFVKGSPLKVTPGTTPVIPTELAVAIQEDALWTGDADDMLYTDVTTAILMGPSVSGAAVSYNLARLGLRVTGLKIDSAVAPASSLDPSAWRVAATSNRILMAVDATIGGDGTVFPSLSSLASSVGHLAAGAGSIDDLAIELLAAVSATGRGCGEGVHALVGNSAMLTALAKSATAKANGSCGWRIDPRTGLCVYHFLGVPFYRCEVAPDLEEKHSLFAVNLGVTGIAMIHGYGSAETYGLEVDQEPTNPGIASRDLLVHGAWTLAMWDPGALFGYNAITLP